MSILKLRLLVLGLILFTGAVHAQQVTTLTPAFQASGDLAVAANGDIYVADFGVFLNNANGTQVYQVTPNGQVSVFASGFAGASGNEIGPDGLLYQSNIGANRVSRVEHDGTLSTVATFTNGIRSPVGLAFTSHGDLYVANCGNNTISKINTDGTVELFISSSLLNCPNGLTADAEDNLYAANFSNGNIIKIDPSGTASVFATTPAGATKPLGGNGHITFGNGQLYVVSNASHQAFSISLAGELTLIAGSGIRGRDDGKLLDASFSLPNGIGLSRDGTRLYVNDSETVGTDNQISPNVVRVIELTSRQPTVMANDGMTGSWFESATTGQGFLIDVKRDIDLFFAAWFTYDNEVQGERRWLTLQGSLGEDAEISVPILNTTGGVFDSNLPTTTEQVGEFTIRFTSCTSAEARYAFSDGLQSGELSLTRISPDVFCEGLSRP